MRIKYYEDDIVEVLSGDYRGDRFYVKQMFDNMFPMVKLKFDFHNRANMDFYPSLREIKLYHRPLKNHIKHFINILLSGINTNDKS